MPWHAAGKPLRVSDVTHTRSATVGSDYFPFSNTHVLSLGARVPAAR